MRQHMMLATGGIAEPAAPNTTKLARPSVDALVRALNKAKSDIAAGRTPTTLYGKAPAPVDPAPPRPGAVPQLMPAVTTVAAAREAEKLDYSSRHQYQWEARLHSIAAMGDKNRPKASMYKLGGASADGSNRVPLAPPPKQRVSHQ
jgi:hypothetical protein